ncbi:MFS transporter [Methanocorpusculum sp.]|nr:MFS transporter [Methanocorpusculum sp.]
MRTSSINPKRVLFVAAFAAFLATFNETYLNVGFAPIMEYFSVDVGTVQWLATAYMLGAAVMVPVSAFLYKSIKTRTLFLTSVGLLIAGSIVAAAAPSFPVLLAGRILQSLGTGMLIPVGMNITLEVAPRKKLGTYMGIMGAMTTIGPASSVILAGVILSFFDWRMLLIVFAVLAIICFLAAAFILGDIAKLTHPKLDVLSTILIGLALIGILYGISTAFTGNVVISAITAVLGILCLILFLRRQNRIEHPLIDLRPLSIRPFAVGVIINMLSLIVIFAMNIVMPIYLQSALGVPAIFASLTLFPAILLSCIISVVAGRVYDKHGPGVLLPLGFACIAVFTAALAGLISTGSLLLFAVLYIPVICGSALIIGPVQSFALSRLSYEMNPHGVIVMSTGFQIAGCIGSSLFAGVYTIGAVSAAETGFSAAALLAALLAVVGFCCALYIRRVSRQAQQEEKPAAEVVMENTLASMMKKDVYSVSASASVLDAVRCMVEHKSSGIPVLSADGRAAGFISDGDVIRYMADVNADAPVASMYPLWKNKELLDAKLAGLSQIPIMQLATEKVVSVKLTAGVAEVFTLLSDKRIKKVPVEDDTGKVVGVLSRSDVLRALLMQSPLLKKE